MQGHQHLSNPCPDVSEKLPERLILTPTSQDPDIRRFGMLPVPFYIRFLILNQLMALCNELAYIFNKSKAELVIFSMMCELNKGELEIVEDSILYSGDSHEFNS